LLDIRFQCRGVSGYKFSIRLFKDGKNYQATAEPLGLRGRHFLTSGDGKIHYEEDRPATSASPEISFPR
jgi:hypothetical protein